MSKTSPLPWSQLMAFGLGYLKLAPHVFWSMTLREMDSAIEGCFGKTMKPGFPSRLAVNDLMAEYPDE